MKRGAGEDALLRWLRAQSPARDAAVLGDDAALLPALPPYAVTVDQQIEGVHFPAGLDPRLLAPRLVEVTLSDLAASGARPAWALLALSAPPSFAHRAFFTALLGALRRHQVRLVGGDLSAAPTVRLSLTVCGTRPPRGRWLRRTAAIAGEALWLGGAVGESAAGCRLLARGARIAGGRVALPREFGGATRSALAAAARRAVRRHLQPRAQLELGRWLGRQRAGAAIDVSDGLSRDLERLCRASGVGAEIDAEALPLARGFPALAAWLGTPAPDLALGGGEDYVLLFTLPPAAVPPRRFGCHRIGRITDGRRLTLRQDGIGRPLASEGFDHLAPGQPRPASAGTKR